MERTPTTDLVRCQSAQASSNQPGAGPLVAVDGSPATGWRPTQLLASLNVPLASQQTISKVTVGWGRQWPPAPGPNVPPPYDLVVSQDGRIWTVLTQVRGRVEGTHDELRSRPVDARFVGFGSPGRLTPPCRHSTNSPQRLPEFLLPPAP
jgi:hypothetical protein